MPETFDAERAFEALAHDVMDRTAPPWAGGAIKRARRRRRTALATAVASAAVVAGVAVPTLADERPGSGVAGGTPETAPLDAAALTEATRGWLGDWTDGPASGSHAEPSCITSPDPGPYEPSGFGRSSFAGADQAGATVGIYSYADATAAYDAWAAANRPLGRCVDDIEETRTPTYQQGDVRHYTVSSDPEADQSAALSDLWLARAGNQVSILKVTSQAGAADSAAITRVSDALMAGLLDGSTQVVEDPIPRPVDTNRAALPPIDPSALEEAFDGWGTAGAVQSSDLPTTPCLSTFSGGVGLHEYRLAKGRYASVQGTDEGRDQNLGEILSRIEHLRGCSSVRMVERSLPGEVTLFVFDRGGDAGHGAIWLAGNEDRAMMVTLDGAATALPIEVGPKVAQFVVGTLDLPWPSAY